MDSLHQITRLLKFDGQKVSCRSIDALRLDARRLRCAVVYIVGPEIPATRIRIATEKIVVMFLHKEARLIDGIRGWRHRVVVGYGHHRRVGSAEGGAHGIAQGDEEKLVSFDVDIVNDQHLK